MLLFLLLDEGALPRDHERRRIPPPGNIYWRGKGREEENKRGSRALTNNKINYTHFPPGPPVSCQLLPPPPHHAFFFQAAMPVIFSPPTHTLFPRWEAANAFVRCGYISLFLPSPIGGAFRVLSLSLSLSLVLPVVAEAHRAEQALATKAPEGEEETTGEGKRSEAIKKSPNRQKGGMEEEGSPPGLDIATKETMTMGDQREEQDKAEGEKGKKKTLERLTMSTSSSGFSSEDEGCGGKQVESAAAMTDSDEKVKASPEEEYSEECCDMKQSAPPLLSLRVKYLGRVDLVEKDFGNKEGKVTRSDVLDICVEELCRRQGKGKEEGEKKSGEEVEEEDAKLELSRENIR